MGIGAGIFLMAVGAILTFAVDVSISGLDIAVIGVVLMIAGLAGIVLELALFAPRRRRRVGYVEPAADVEVYDDVPVAGDPRVHRRVTTDYRTTR
jgi:uncharacterized protein (DUF58 family)